MIRKSDLVEGRKQTRGEVVSSKSPIRTTCHLRVIHNSLKVRDSTGSLDSTRGINIGPVVYRRNRNFHNHNRVYSPDRANKNTLSIKGYD